MINYSNITNFSEIMSLEFFLFIFLFGYAVYVVIKDVQLQDDNLHLSKMVFEDAGEMVFMTAVFAVLETDKRLNAKHFHFTLADKDGTVEKEWDKLTLWTTLREIQARHLYVSKQYFILFHDGMGGAFFPSVSIEVTKERLDRWFAFDEKISNEGDLVDDDTKRSEG